MSLRAYLRILRKRWLIIGTVTLLGAGLGVAVTVTADPAYRARAESFVTIAGTGAGTGAILQGSQFTIQRVGSYTELVDSPFVLEPVIEQLGLDETVTSLAQRVDATNPNDTVLIYVTADDSSPSGVVALADAVALSLGREIERLETPEKGPAPVLVTLVRPATEPAGPFSPRPRFNVALGLMVGLAAGVGLALLRDSLDVTIKQADTLADLTRSTTLGVVWLNTDLAKDPLVALDRRSPHSEPYRTIRTNLQFVDVDTPAKSLVVTSSVMGEGKSTVAANVAIACGQAGLRVCLVEADLRRPRIADMFGIEASVGLSNVLAGQHLLAEALVSWNRGLVTILGAGTLPPGPTEMLASRAMGTLLEQLRKEHDIVIVDAPPLLPVTDAAILAKLTDGAMIIGQYGRVTRPQVERARQTLDQVGAAVLGNVLTSVPARGRDVRYSYGYAPSSGASGEGGEVSTPTDPASVVAARLDAIDAKHRRDDST